MRQVIHAVNDPEAANGLFDRAAADLSKFWKEVVVEGEFLHPTTGDRISIDQPRLERWKARFDSMKGEGLTVPIPYGHKNLYDCEKHAGTVEAADVRQRQDGRYALWMLCDIPREEDASRIGKTIKGVSVGINYDFQSTQPDGKLRHWGEVLDHLALTNAPVIHQTEGFIPVEDDETVPAARIAASRGARAIPDGDLALSVAHLSRERGDLAVSAKPWGGVDKAKLPASCHLYIGDPKQPSTWKLPVYEGTGALVDAPSTGTKILSARGPLNINGLVAAAGVLEGAHEGVGIPDADHEALARKVARLLKAHDRAPTEGLLKVAGFGLTRDAGDLRGLLSPEAASALSVEIAAALGVGPPEVRGVTAAKDAATPGEDDMKLSDLIAKLKTVAPRTGLSIADDADEAAVVAFLDALPGKIPEPPPPETPETEREKALRLEVEGYRVEKRTAEVKTAKAHADALMSAGSITKRQHEILCDLLTVGGVKVTNLAVEGAAEKLVEKDAAVGALLLEFAKAIPEGAVTGKKTVAVKRDDDKDADKVKAADAATQKRMLSRAGADPETGIVGGGNR